MVEAIKKLTQAFGAGALGGLISSLVFIILYRAGAMAMLGVTYFPGKMRTVNVWGPDRVLSSTTLPWLYEGVALYGLCGFLFLVPWIKGSQAQRGLICALFPAAFELLYMFHSHNDGIFGLGYGAFTFVFVLLYNAIWGFVTVSFVPGSGS